MTLQNKLIIIAVGLALLVLSFFTGRWTYNTTTTITKPYVVHDTTYKYTDVDHYITITKVKLETVSIAVHDTIQPITVASTDTTICNDSTYVKYFYPPLNTFFVDSHYKQQTITVTDSVFIPPALPSFWSRFNYSIQAGAGYGVIHKQPDIFIGVGASINLKNIF